MAGAEGGKVRGEGGRDGGVLLACAGCGQEEGLLAREGGGRARSWELFKECSVRGDGSLDGSQTGTLKSGHITDRSTKVCSDVVLERKRSKLTPRFGRRIGPEGRHRRTGFRGSQALTAGRGRCAVLSTREDVGVCEPGRDAEEVLCVLSLKLGIT